MNFRWQIILSPLIIIMVRRDRWSVYKGIVSNIRSNDGVTFLQTDAAMNHGNSGGPLIHLTTRTVLGINTLKLDESSAYGIGFAVSADEVRKAFPNLR